MRKLLINFSPLSSITFAVENTTSAITSELFILILLVCRYIFTWIRFLRVLTSDEKLILCGKLSLQRRSDSNISEQVLGFIDSLNSLISLASSATHVYGTVVLLMYPIKAHLQKLAFQFLRGEETCKFIFNNIRIHYLHCR